MPERLHTARYTEEMWPQYILARMSKSCSDLWARGRRGEGGRGGRERRGGEGGRRRGGKLLASPFRPSAARPGRRSGNGADEALPPHQCSFCRPTGQCSATAMTELRRQAFVVSQDAARALALIRQRSGRRTALGLGTARATAGASASAHLSLSGAGTVDAAASVVAGAVAGAGGAGWCWLWCWGCW
jgi:hypothetical protein